MAEYKKPCLHCGNLVETDSRMCPFCASASPFVVNCPACLKPVERSWAICSGCGRPLTVPCPHCNQPTFVGERCEKCGVGLMISCQNKRCAKPQFFENTKCTACGKKIKKRKFIGRD